MSKLFGKGKKVDRDIVCKWLFFGLAGILGIVANVFDTRHKDKVYRDTLDETIAAQAKKLLEEDKAA